METTVLEKPIAVDHKQRRRYFRYPCSVNALVREGRSGLRESSARVLNASPTGMCLEISMDQSFAPQEVAVVTWRPILEIADSAEDCSVVGKVVHVAENAERRTRLYGIEFSASLDEQINAATGLRRKILTVAIGLVIASIIVFLKSRNVVSFWYEPLFQAYSLGAAIFVLSRVAVSLFYRPPKDMGVLKSISIIIAAKNEEERIAETIRHCYQSHYPEHLLEIIAVDDGSTDGTWKEMEKLYHQTPGMKAIRFPVNKGKRHAMAIGAQKARGEILVFIDSDTYLNPDGLQKIIQPFADPRVGAVAGHTLVIVEPKNFISKMEAIRYFVSQRVMKASESVFGAVGCCPGPFSAYRRSVVLKVLPDWLNQTFLGTEATFGDDRSLTNCILRDYRVVYHSGAKSATYVPDRWKVFFRQQLRWKKSWVRETTIAARFMWKKHPFVAISYYLGVIITLMSPFVALRALFYLPVLFGSASFFPYIAGLLLVYGFFGLIYQYFAPSPRWYYGLAFAMLYVSILSFQNYYAILTVRRNHWGTR
jgi:hyaluronan synthase